MGGWAVFTVPRGYYRRLDYQFDFHESAADAFAIWVFDYNEKTIPTPHPSYIVQTDIEAISSAVVTALRVYIHTGMSQ